MIAPSQRELEVERHLLEHLKPWARCFVSAEVSYRVDAFLLAAICDRESRGGLALSPRGPTGTGDNGHGRGLMQIDDRWHPGFLSATDDRGVHLWKIAEWNIDYGAHVLSRYRALLDGNELAAIAAYNAGPGKVRRVMGTVTLDEAALVKLLDAVTTGGNYVSDVLRRRAGFLKAPTPSIT